MSTRKGKKRADRWSTPAIPADQYLYSSGGPYDEVPPCIISSGDPGLDSGWGDPCLSSSSEIPGVNRIADMNEDVLQLIFEHFDLQPGSKSAAQTRKDLLSAAKVCKKFAEPALNSLWRVLPSLLPLLLLLPSAEIVGGHYFIDNLPFSNWERFEIHARRVRALYMEAPRVVISPITYVRIRSMCNSPLLPGLKAIYIPDHNPIDFPSIILLVLEASLDIVELNSSAISERNFFIPFLTSLAEKSPQLGHLALRGPGNISLEPVYRFTNLQRLEIRLSSTYFYPQTLRRLGSLVNLLDLTLDVGASTPAPAVDTRLHISSPSSYRYTGRLRRLHIIGVPSSITRVLDDINLASLTTLVIDEVLNDEGVQMECFWRRCFDQISVCHAIEDIEINQLDSAYRYWSHEHYSLSISWFFSLLNLKNMKSLVVNGAALSGSDEDFRLLACAFPKLKKLVVPSEYYSQGRTLACLFYFAQECPDLREIQICLAFDIHKNLDAIQDLPTSISVVHQHPLEKLYISSQFGHIQPTHMVQVAEFLDLFFPNLSISDNYSSDPTEDSNWTGIQRIRVALQAARINAFQRAKCEMDMTKESKNESLKNSRIVNTEDILYV